MNDIQENMITVPEYLNNETFKTCLEKGLRQAGIEIIDTKISLGSKPGENYTSTIYNVSVTYKNGNEKNTQIANLLVKSILTGEGSEFFEKAGMINKEINVYTKILPKLHSILPGTNFSPRCYHIFTEPCRNFVFENMQAHGYKLGDRELGLDENHIIEVLKKMAKFHAASMILLKENTQITKDYQHGFFNETCIKEPLFQKSMYNTLDIAGKKVSTMPGYQHFEEKFKKFGKTYESVILKTIEFDAAGIHVLNHGDTWVNNFLYKYDDRNTKPVDTVFVDFQGSCFNSPGIDINYLFITSAQLDVLSEKYELIKNYYYPSLKETLEKLDYSPIPTLEEILNEVRGREMYTILCLLAVLPFISMNREESITNDIAKFNDTDIMNKKLLVGMSSRRFIETMKYTLKELENVFDQALAEFS